MTWKNIRKQCLYILQKCSKEKHLPQLIILLYSGSQIHLSNYWEKLHSTLYNKNHNLRQGCLEEIWAIILLSQTWRAPCRPSNLCCPERALSQMFVDTQMRWWVFNTAKLSVCMKNFKRLAFKGWSLYTVLWY